MSPELSKSRCFISLSFKYTPSACYPEYSWRRLSGPTNQPVTSRRRTVQMSHYRGSLFSPRRFNEQRAVYRVVGDPRCDRWRGGSPHSTRGRSGSLYEPCLRRLTGVGCRGCAPFLTEPPAVRAIPSPRADSDTLLRPTCGTVEPTDGRSPPAPSAGSARWLRRRRCRRQTDGPCQRLGSSTGWR